MLFAVVGDAYCAVRCWSTDDPLVYRVDKKTHGADGWRGLTVLTLGSNCWESQSTARRVATENARKVTA